MQHKNQKNNHLLWPVLDHVPTSFQWVFRKNEREKGSHCSGQCQKGGTQEINQ